MHFFKPLVLLSVLHLASAAPLPISLGIDSDDSFTYDVVNVDGSNLQVTSSLIFDQDLLLTVDVAAQTTSYPTLFKRGKKTTWVTETVGTDTAHAVPIVTDLPDSFTSTTSTSTTCATSTPKSSVITPATTTTTTTTKNNAKSSTGGNTTTPSTDTTTSSTAKTSSTQSATYTIIDGETYMVQEYVSTIRPATTIVFLTTYTTTFDDGRISTVAETTAVTSSATTVTPITTSTTDSTTSSTSTSTSTTTSSSTASSSNSSSFNVASSIPSETAAPTTTTTSSSSTSTTTSTSLQTSTTVTSTITPTSSLITDVPVTSTSSSFSSDAAYTTIAENGVCNIYIDDGLNENYYVSGTDASSAETTTTITRTVYQTVSLN